MVCAERRDGVCATYKKTLRYQNSVKTVCGYYISNPFGFTKGKPTCIDCKSKLKGKKK